MKKQRFYLNTKKPLNNQEKQRNLNTSVARKKNKKIQKKA